VKGPLTPRFKKRSKEDEEPPSFNPGRKKLEHAEYGVAYPKPRRVEKAGTPPSTQRVLGRKMLVGTQEGVRKVRLD